MASLAGAALAALALSACGGEHVSVRREDPPPDGDEHYVAGALAFGEYCKLCHAADATGYAADHAPSLVSSTFLESATDDFLARGIRDGRPGTAMAPYAKSRGGPLEEDDVTSIIAFLRDRGPLRVRLPSTAVVGDARSGEAVYAASCQRCHGTRTDRADAVHLANPLFLATATDAFLRHAIVHGRPGTPMPAFDGALRGDEIDNVVAMLRGWSSPPEPNRHVPAEPPPLGQVVMNPRGGTPELKLRDGRFASLDDVYRAFDGKKRMIIIDARPASDWYNLRIPGSVSVPYYTLARLDPMPKDGTWIIAYCACPHHASGVVVDELRKRGYPNTAVMDEGIFAWQRRGFPTTSDPAPGEGEAPHGPVKAAPAKEQKVPRR
jgi:mono/diheme cytochrome c family protein/rhodanese-related sulfurtransferase